MGLLQKSDAACCGITIGQCHTLVEIGRSGGISLNELSERLNLDKSTMSRTVDNLVNGGFVERQTDSEDRRYAKISLTLQGIELFTVINQSMKTYLQAMFEQIPEDKQELVKTALPYLLTAVNNSELFRDLPTICSGTQITKKERC
jgi:DNA-binding MarR family transcriptional regulator